MKKALITGANGFIGSLLAEELLKNNVEVIAADLQGHNDKVPPQARFVDFDMHNCEELTKNITDKDIDAVQGCVQIKRELIQIMQDGNAKIIVKDIPDLKQIVIVFQHQSLRIILIEGIV